METRANPDWGRPNKPVKLSVRSLRPTLAALEISRENRAEIGRDCEG